MYVKPADRLIEGIPLKVRDPDLGDHLPPEGREVPDTLYWHRRLMDGDAVRCEPPAEVTFIDSDGKEYPLSAINKATLTEIPADPVD